MRHKNEAEYRTTIHSDQGWHYQHNKWKQVDENIKEKQNLSKYV